MRAGLQGSLERSGRPRGVIVSLGFLDFASGYLLPMTRPSPDFEMKTTEGNNPDPKKKPPGLGR
jgi:hypothetical protein